MIFVLGFLGSVILHHYKKPVEEYGFWLKFLANFQFTCEPGYKSRWFIEKSAASMMLWKFHFIVIFMYTTLIMIVLFKIPYKYDRIRKNKKEKKIDRKKR